MIAFVLAAGLGTRFRPETRATPKPLLLLAGRPILFHVFDHLLEQGAEAFVVNAHHLAEELRGAVGESYEGVPVAWSFEEEILGTAGGIRRAHAHGLLGTGSFLVANGDLPPALPLWRPLAAPPRPRGRGGRVGGAGRGVFLGRKGPPRHAPPPRTPPRGPPRARGRRGARRPPERE